MAETSPPQTDLKTHVKVYDRFIRIFTRGAIVAFVIAAIVIYLIAS